VTETGNALSRQPGGVSFSLFDELIKKSVCEGGTSKGVFAAPPGAKLSKLEKELQLEVASGTVKVSNSIDDIARWIGVSPEVLKTTVVEYNSFCGQGYDGAFAKDRKYLQPLRTPPYYATMCGRSLLTTIGGIKINYRTEVISMQGKPIPGLYAVGNDAGGWEPETYDMALAGFAQGFALNSGRIAGENAANYSLVK
jgi:fumarate reductase flavoprotein subunit